jgi:hypothetical protein
MWGRNPLLAQCSAPAREAALARTASCLLLRPSLDSACARALHAVQGGGGATGSASLDSLMDKIPFRAKPKIVDLTSQRKLADKVGITCAGLF